MRYLRNLLVWAVVLSFVSSLVLYFFLPLYRTRVPREEISYSQFISYAEAGRIAEITIDDGAITGRLTDNQSFRTYVPRADAPYLPLLQSRNVQIYVEPRTTTDRQGGLLVFWLPFLFLFAMGLLTLRQASRAQRPEELTEVLKRRLARGEISKEQYEDLKRILAD